MILSMSRECGSRRALIVGESCRSAIAATLTLMMRRSQEAPLTHQSNLALTTEEDNAHLPCDRGLPGIQLQVAFHTLRVLCLSESATPSPDLRIVSGNGWAD